MMRSSILVASTLLNFDSTLKTPNRAVVNLRGGGGGELGLMCYFKFIIF